MKNKIQNLVIVLCAVVAGLWLFKGQFNQTPVRIALSTVSSSAIVDSNLPDKLPQGIVPPPRTIIRQQVNEVLAELSKQLGATTPEQTLSLDKVQDAVYQNLLSDKQSEDLVAALLQSEASALQNQNTKEGPQEINPGSAYLLLPYLVEAGLCDGDIWSKQGLVCSYAGAWT